MRSRLQDKKKAVARPRGAIVVVAALILVVLTMFIALAVDTGVIAAAKAQLKTVTDAAALAGARQLASDRRLSTTIANLAPEMAAATAKAIAAGNANTVLGNSPGLTGANVVIGYKSVRSPNQDPPDAAVNTAGASTQYNSVQVTATATIPGLFSAPFRANGSTVSVTSTATVEPVPTQGFRGNGTANASILPIVMDEDAYNRMIGGTGGDAFSFTPGNYNPPTSNGVSSGADGVKESVIYPVSAGLSGNWGTIDFGVSNNSTSTLGNQIRNGVTPAQMLAEYPDGTVTVPHQFGANPGISAGIKDDLTSIIGKSVTVPIYDDSGGNGNNAWYRVVKFASVRIVAVDLTGKDKYVVVQPAINSDPTAIPDRGQVNPWSSGGIVFLHLSR